MGDETTPVESCFLYSPIGWLKVTADASGLTGLEFISEPPKAPGSVTLPHLKEAYRQLSEYFRGERVSFSLPMNLTGSSFERSVWERLASLPAGAAATSPTVAGAASAVDAPSESCDPVCVQLLEREGTTLDI